MRYKYTWSHIKILASICECDDTKVTITSNWINLLEEHHRETFPFTLWPLSYRTSTIMASSAICTPKCSNIDVSVSCTMTVKIYKSNEVMVVCFQHKNKRDGSSGSESNCEQCLGYPCVFESVTEAENGENPSLLKTFKKIKSKTSREINKVIHNSSIDGGDISCMIFTGYGIGAAMASFMARDRALSQKKQQEHMNMDTPSIIVDCVTFESPANLAGDKYWKQMESIVD